MDNYLLEQKKQLKTHKLELVKSIFSALKIILIIAGIVCVIAFFAWLGGSKQNVDQWITSEIVFQKMENSGSRNNPDYYIFDQYNNKYRSLASDEKNEELLQKLVKGKGYIITYSLGISDKQKTIYLLKDSSHVYLNGEKLTNSFDKLMYLRIILFCICFIAVIFAAVFVWKSAIIKRSFTRVLLNKKRINYFKQHGEFLPEELSLDSAYEKVVQDLKRSDDNDYFNAATTPVILAKYIQNAQDSYHEKELFKRAVILQIAGSIILYVGLTMLLTVNFQNETAWQTKEIIFTKISAESHFLPGIHCYCLYDQSGNQYELPSSVEYQYLDLKKQLVLGQSYEIAWGSNKYLFKDRKYLYGLNDGAKTYVNKKAAAETFIKYNEHLKKLFIICPPLLILIIYLTFSRSVIIGRINNELENKDEVIAWLKGLLCFYEHTGLMLPEMYPPEKIKVANGIKIMCEYKFIDQLAANGRRNVFNKDIVEVEAVFLHNQFAASRSSLFICGLSLLLLGALWLFTGLQQKNNMHLFCAIAYIVLGLELFILAIWIILLSRPKRLLFSERIIVVYESATVY